MATKRTGKERTSRRGTSRIPIGMIWKHAAPRRNISFHTRKTIRRMKRKTRRASKTSQQDDMTRRRNGDTGIGRDATRETQIRRNETSKQDETMDEMRNETPDETNKNDTSKQRDDRIERTRRPHGTHARDEGRDDIGGTSASATDKGNQAHEKKHQINTFIARPPHHLLSIARRPQIIPRPRAEGRAGGEMDSKQEVPSSDERLPPYRHMPHVIVQRRQ